MKGEEPRTERPTVVSKRAERRAKGQGKRKEQQQKQLKKLTWLMAPSCQEETDQTQGRGTFDESGARQALRGSFG